VLPIIRNDCKSIHEGGGSNQNVCIANQFSPFAKVRINVGCSQHNIVSDREGSVFRAEVFEP
jgi:hypothetical protein